MSQRQSRIVVVGSLNIDFVIRVPRLPSSGETVAGTGFMTSPGGKGANQAVAAARLRNPVSAGLPVWMVGCIGEDVYGEQLIKSLLSADVETGRLIRTKEAPTGVAVITVEENGQNQIVVAAGANHRLPPETATKLLAEIDGSHLLLQLETPLETIKAAIHQARRQEMIVILDPAPARPLAPALLHHVDILTPNETEALALLGLDGNEVRIEDASDIARRLLELGPRRIVLKLGEKGCALADEAQVRLFPARAVRAVDTTAAGDCFNGALAVALAEGKTIEAAIEFATCAASIAVTRPGAQDAMPHRREVDAILMK